MGHSCHSRKTSVDALYLPRNRSYYYDYAND